MLVRRIGTVLAWVSPAGFTTVPMTVSTPSASNWAIAAAASGVAVMAVILQRGSARAATRGKHRYVVAASWRDSDRSPRSSYQSR